MGSANFELPVILNSKPFPLDLPLRYLIFSDFKLPLFQTFFCFPWEFKTALFNYICYHCLIQGQCGMGQWTRASCTAKNQWKFKHKSWRRPTRYRLMPLVLHVSCLEPGGLPYPPYKKDEGEGAMENFAKNPYEVPRSCFVGVAWIFFSPLKNYPWWNNAILSNTLEIVVTIAAPAFDILFIGYVLNTKIVYTTAEELMFEALHWPSNAARCY